MTKRTIELAPLPSGPGAEYQLGSGKTGKISCKTFKGRIEVNWKVASYSSLISRQSIDLELPDHDLLRDSYNHPRDYFSEFSEPELGQVPAPGKENILSFPKGARAGVFFHNLFEHLDFNRDDTKQMENLITRKLQEYGFDAYWKKAILQMIDTVLCVPLIPDRKDFVLASLTAENRINEMAFFFPLNPIAPSDLVKLFTKNGGIHIKTGFPERLGKLTFSPVGGYMKGYIDMIFKHRERFYLVDWKSNDLGSDIEKYQTAFLAKTMDQAYYILQYHLYILALHQYLQLRVPGYSYQNNFGGVFYIFLRGVDHRKGRQYGIFHDLPSQDIIVALGHALIPGFQGPGR